MLFRKRRIPRADGSNTFEIRLLGELDALFDTFMVDWPEEHVPNSLGIVGLVKGSKVLRMPAPRSGSFYFWQIIDVQDSCRFKTLHLRSPNWFGKRVDYIKKQLDDAWGPM